MTIEDLVYGFQARLKELAEEYPEVVDRLVALEPEEGRYDGVIMLGRRAADLLVAPSFWSLAVGDVIDTTELSRRLGASRQAIADRVNNRTLLALPGRRSRMYPTWQFTWAEPFEVRDAVPTLLRLWYAAEPDVEPLTIAAWANAHSELLDGRRPREVLVEGDDQAFLAAAQATVHQRTR